MRLHLNGHVTERTLPGRRLVRLPWPDRRPEASDRRIRALLTEAAIHRERPAAQQGHNLGQEGGR
jgi:hypothetical protein